MNADVAIERFVQYIQIKTVQPEPDYPSAMKFFAKYAEELGLEFRTIETDRDRHAALLSVSVVVFRLIFSSIRFVDFLVAFRFIR